MPSDPWIIANERHDPATLARFNSVFTISNGYFGLKGNLAEDRDGPCPTTIINGIYDELDMFGQIRASAKDRPWLDPDHFDTAGKSPAVANLPNPLFVRVFVDGREVSLGCGTISGFRQDLDLRSGAVHCRYDYNNGHAGLRIEAWRFASLAEPHRAFMRYRITPRTDVSIRMLSGIDARVHSNITGERQFSIVALDADTPELCRLHARTRARRHDIHLTVAHRLICASGPREVRGVCEHDAVYTQSDFDARAHEPITIERTIDLRSSEDVRHGDLLRAGAPLYEPHDYDAALAEQRRRWQELWNRADVQIDGDATAQLHLRFCLYHLLAAAPRFTDRLSVPVKLLTGEYYQGNTFYDTETHILPFYIFTCPEYARTCLNFRHAGLTHGRELARALGGSGAKFAWQAGPYGEECLGPWYRFPRTNIHINAAVTHSLMQYFWATGDESFLRSRGADILVESARFYTSRASHDAARDTYDFRDVAGPDEAHCRSVSNFYTNYLAARALRYAAGTVAALAGDGANGGDELAARLKLHPDEPGQWRHIAERLTLLYDPRTKLYEQCAGFFRLPPPPADLLEKRGDWFVPLARYQAMNQPDVVMALALFRDDFSEDVRRANWDYYRSKSMDFSSMSYAVNAIMATDLGDTAAAYRNFAITAGIDLTEALTGRHDTHAGLHGSALGGAWLAAVFGFGGVQLSERGLRITPNLPDSWDALRFNLVLRGKNMRVTIDLHEVCLERDDATPLGMPIAVGGQVVSDEPQCHVRYCT